MFKPMPIFQDCPEAALDSVIKICEGLSAAHRNIVVQKLAELELVQNSGSGANSG